MADVSTADCEELTQLEESLWRTETRFDRDHLERVLAPDFFEFGQSGRAHRRADVLAGEAREINTTLRDLRVRPLATDVVLVTYISELHDADRVVAANRSSIWTRTEGQWRLRFHQGTPAARES
jgi:hypothetical protein